MSKSSYYSEKASSLTFGLIDSKNSKKPNYHQENHSTPNSTTNTYQMKSMNTQRRYGKTSI